MSDPFSQQAMLLPDGDGGDGNGDDGGDDNKDDVGDGDDVVSCPTR